MTYDEAIESLLKTCENLKETIEQLQKENTFLADTIEKNNLGQIRSERRSLLLENKQCKKIQEDYESKISEAENILVDVKKKQADINSYIDAEVKKKVVNIQIGYERRIKENNEDLERHKAENDKLVQKKELLYKKKSKKHLIITLISICLAIIGIAVNFV